MNWIKNNRFVAALAGITIVICAILYLLGSKWGTSYKEVKSEFDASYGQVSASERILLYPNTTNRDGKLKALGEYRESIEQLRKMFDGYRPGPFTELSPQAFTDRLKKATDKTSAALKDAKCELPDGYFLGFDKYDNQLAPSGATGALSYQLDGIEYAMMALAESRPSKLIKLYRDVLPEESGGKYTPEPNDVTRNFGFELTFKGSEMSVRKFLTSLGATEKNYYVVRCLKIENEKTSPPNVSDAKFEKTPAEKEAAKPVSPFEAFNFGGAVETPSVLEPPTAGAPAADSLENKPAPEAAAVDSSRMLAQVLGSEELIVFVRFDLAMFLPTKELPKL